MKKKLLLFFIALITISLLVFSACNDPANDGDDGDQTENGDGTENNGGTQLKYSEGLEFELSDDETYYSVKGIGTCTDTKLVIPYEYNGKPVTSIGYAAFRGCKGLTSVTISDSVTSIGASAFCNCTGLKSVTIPNSVESIGDYAFNVCSELASVTIGNSVTSIGERAFYNCTGLTSITVLESNSAYKSIDGNLYTKDGKTLIQYAIGKTETSFVIPNSVTSICNSAFEDCTRLTSVTIGNSVTSIGSSAFNGCTGLTSVTIPNSVTSIGAYAFYKCTRLTNINYRGTEAQWNAVSKGSSWDANTGNYTITYNYTGE